mmetsp:Transcript_8431/g.9575  ORF Transcript_8431/g.9575 Transcript_8431/m.9575 type:complete len:99 (+) Transcript_8431:94-390(+)
MYKNLELKRHEDTLSKISSESINLKTTFKRVFTKLVPLLNSSDIELIFEDRYTFKTIEEEIEDFLSKSQDLYTDLYSTIKNNIRLVIQNLENLGSHNP